MDFDFNLVLVPLTLVLGLIWLLDKLFLKQRKTRGKGKESMPINWAYEFFPILAIIVVVRSFIIEPFNIPSSSMVPTLYTGDFIVVNKSAYGIKLPLINTKILDTGSPKHGDVAVFRFPQNPKQYYIKRVIGLPGDTVSYNDGILFINEKPVKTEVIEFTAEQDMVQEMYPAGTSMSNKILSANEAGKLGQQEESMAHYLQETQGQKTHLIRELADLESAAFADFLQAKSPEVIDSNGKKWKIVVPKDHYFVMGDNRDRSRDSRFWGFVPEENLAGKAVYIWMHKKPGLNNLPTFSRNGTIE